MLMNEREEIDIVPIVSVYHGNLMSYCAPIKGLSFPSGSPGKEYTCNVGDLGSIPGLGRSLREGNGYPLQYSDLENSLDCVVHGVAKSRTQLNNSLSLSPYTRQYM